MYLSIFLGHKQQTLTLFTVNAVKEQFTGRISRPPNISGGDYRLGLRKKVVGWKTPRDKNVGIVVMYYNGKCLVLLVEFQLFLFFLSVQDLTSRDNVSQKLGLDHICPLYREEQSTVL